MANLIPNLKTYIDHGYPILIVARHGIGKTAEVKNAVAELDLNLAYFNCATLDPYTNLIGVPFPEDDNDLGEKVLKLVRPKTLDHADVIFFDEINRAPSETTNAVFEIVQFGSINGEKLPNLKCVIAAVNPAGDDEMDYDVNSIDPALQDRFFFTFNLKPKYSVDYMVKEENVDRSVAQALVDWVADSKDQENYISPRRLSIIGKVITETRTITGVKSLLPTGNFNWKDLQKNLRVALLPEEERESITSIENKKLEEQAQKIIEILNEFQIGDTFKPELCTDSYMNGLKHVLTTSEDTNIHIKVGSILGQGFGHTRAINNIEVIAELNPAGLDSWCGGFCMISSRVSQFRSACHGTPNPSDALKKVENAIADHTKMEKIFS